MQYNFRPKINDNVEKISLADEQTIYDFLLERSQQIKAGDKETDQRVYESSSHSDTDT